jgi:tetratricopeptide (TPR) repeat protein
VSICLREWSKCISYGKDFLLREGL